MLFFYSKSGDFIQSCKLGKLEFGNNILFLGRHMEILYFLFLIINVYL